MLHHDLTAIHARAHTTAARAARAGHYDLASLAGMISAALDDDAEPEPGRCDNCGADGATVRVSWPIGEDERESARHCVEFEACAERAAARVRAIVSREPIVAGLLATIAEMEPRRG